MVVTDVPATAWQPPWAASAAGAAVRAIAVRANIFLNIVTPWCQGLLHQAVTPVFQESGITHKPEDVAGYKVRYKPLGQAKRSACCHPDYTRPGCTTARRAPRPPRSRTCSTAPGPRR